jgi:hypothetical protein
MRTRQFIVGGCVWMGVLLLVGAVQSLDIRGDQQTLPSSPQDKYEKASSRHRSSCCSDRRGTS